MHFPTPEIRAVLSCKRMAADSDLPIYNPVSGIGRREAWKLRSMEKRIHFIPLILILCFIILWFFGSQANVSIEDEDFNDPIEIKNSDSLKEMNVRVDLAMLSLATAPMNASDPEPPFQETPEIAPSPVRVTRITDLSPAGSSVSTSFSSGRVLLQEGNVKIRDEKIIELSEIEKPERINKTRIDFASCSVAARGNASSGLQPLLQANPEILPLQSAGSGL